MPTSKPPLGTPNPLPYKELLNQPQFLKLWTSQLLSQLTINLVNFSILTHIYHQTQSTVAVSLLWISYSLPALFFAPFAGTIVDHFSLRRMMVGTNILQALTVLSYLLIGNNIFLLYSLVFLYSALDQLYLPAQQASIPWLVAKKLLPAANGIFFLTQQASFLVGFGLGGVFLYFLGRSTTIVLSYGALVIAAFAVSRLPLDRSRVRLNLPLEKFFFDFKEGYTYVTTHPQTRLPLVLIIVFQVLITVISILLPSYTNQVLGLSLEHAGIILIIPGSIGALILTRTLPRTLKKSRKKLVIQTGMLIGALSLFLMAFMGFFGSYKVILAVVMAMGLGISLASVIVPSHTLLQEKTPAELRGRTYSVLGFLMTVSTAVPMLIIASLADLLGIGFIIAFMASLLLVGFIFIKYRADHVLANGSWI